jgi:hypothetical protein
MWYHLILLAVILSAWHLSAQTGPLPLGEFSVSFGIGAAPELFGMVDDEVLYTSPAGDLSMENRRFSGAWNFSYRRFVEDKIGVALHYTAERTVRDIVFADNGELSGNRIMRYNTVLISGDYWWIRRNGISLYSQVAAGAGLFRYADTNDFTETVHRDTETVFAYQLTPIGFRFGYNLAMFAELGIGFRGLANVGISISF